MKENLQDETMFEPMAPRPNLHDLTICCPNQESGGQTPCQSNQEDEENHKTQNDKAGTSSVDTTTLRDFRLFEQWVDKASGAISVYCRYSTPCLENLNPDKHVFVVQVDFDYNQKNFRPIGQAPEISDLDDDQTLSTFQHANEKDCKSVSTGVVKYKEYALTVPIYLNLVTKDETNDNKTQADADWMVEYYGQDQLLRHKVFNDIQLESSIFRHWSELEQDNRHKSYHHLMATDKFVQFVTHALHLPCRRRPRHKTSVVMLVITFGFALGQIESLDKFFVLPRNEAMDNLEVWYHLTPKARKRLEKQCTAKSSGRDDDGDSVVDTTIILLAHASRKMFVQHLGISSKSVPPLPPCVCDQKAKFYFSELQKQSPPRVDSPCLNEIVKEYSSGRSTACGPKFNDEMGFTARSKGILQLGDVVFED